VNKFFLAGKNLTLLFCLFSLVLPALLAALIPDDHARDLVAQMRLQFIYGGLTALLLMSACKSWSEHPRLSTLALLALLCQFVTVISAYIFWPENLAVKKEPTQLSVMNSNLFIGNLDFEKFALLVGSKQPDVICLQELTLNWAGTLAKLKSRYPYQAVYATNGYDGTGILSRYPIIDQKLLAIQPGSFPLLMVSIDVPNKANHHQHEIWTVATVHLSTPMALDRFQSRNEEMAKIAVITSKLTPPALLCGDFNCVPWSQYFATLEKDCGLRNSIRGFMPELTWTDELPDFVRIPIDHMLVSPAVKVRAHTKLSAIGSDHYPIMMQVEY